MYVIFLQSRINWQKNYPDGQNKLCFWYLKKSLAFVINDNVTYLLNSFQFWHLVVAALNIIVLVKICIYLNFIQVPYSNINKIFGSVLEIKYVTENLYRQNLKSIILIIVQASSIYLLILFLQRRKIIAKT